jgi:2',3'-cyclic-nucleotide 2'-phosphodiesterase (5'-nucleotidase family)
MNRINRKAAMKKSSPFIILLISLLSFSCHTSYNPQSVEYTDYRVKQERITDSTMVHLLEPYSTRLYSSMNEVIGEVSTNLEKRQPEGTLGNLMVDAMMYSATKKFKKHVDVAFMNYGGIRLNQIPVGPMTRGKLYELSPFDNYIVLIDIKGSLFKQFLDHIAGRGGWPVAGMTMQIADKKAQHILIGGKPLDQEAQYTIALLDYTANGGDDSYMLKNLPQQNGGFLLRDELQEYFLQLQKEGKKISARVEGRVTTN